MTDSLVETEGVNAPNVPQANKILLVPPNTLQPIRIKSGPVELVGGGMVIPFSNNSIEVLIGSPNSFRLLIILEEEDQVSQTRISLTTVDSRTAQLTCFNFRKQPSTVGNVDPLHVANIGTEPMYLNFRVQPVTSSDPIFFYTFYVGKAANE